MNIYFETSAVNWFAKKYSVQDAIATNAFQSVRGRKWQISPITIWEILLTNDEGKREELIFQCQHLFHSELLPAPEELIVSFVEQGCPLFEKARTLRSHTAEAVVWRDICNDKRKTFVLNRDDLKRRVDLLTQLSKLIRQVVRGKGSHLISGKLATNTDMGLGDLLKRQDFYRAAMPVSKNTEAIWKLSLLYVLVIFCSEVSPNNGVTRAFWTKHSIKKPLERLSFVLKEHPGLVTRGPILEMAIMTHLQSNHEFSRGVLFDSLHSVYLPYVDMLLTNDAHFLLMKENISWHPHARRIHSVNGVKWTAHARDVQLPTYPTP